MGWNLLSNAEEKLFHRGVVFRFPAKYPFENTVDFMIIEDLDSPINLKLICSTGYHAGQTELVFPKEAEYEGGGLSVEWLRINWQKWVYQDCSIADVKYVEEYWPNIGDIA